VSLFCFSDGDPSRIDEGWQRTKLDEERSPAKNKDEKKRRKEKGERGNRT